MRPSKILLFALMPLMMVGAFTNLAIGATTPPDLRNKLVLANPDKYRVTLRFGTAQRKLEPRKASVLSPKKYPVTLEFFSGKSTTGWLKQQITSAGVYDFRWQGGRWTLTRRPIRTASRSQTSRTRTSVPSYRRSAGSYQRTAQRRPTYMPWRPVYRSPRVHPRWSYWTRGVWGLATLYQFVRDEEDRDILREIIIGGEIDDAVRREIEDELRDRLVAVPFEERRELERAIDDVSRLNPDDWKDITTLPADDWDRLRGEIDGEIADADWDGMEDWADTLDDPVGDTLDLGDDFESMDENLDLGGLDGLADMQGLDAVAGGPDFDFGQDIEDIDLGDIAGDAQTMDLSDFDDGGYGGGMDFGDMGVGDMGVGDLGGGWDAGGGYDFDPGGYDMGGFDDWGGGGFDAGGFDDFGGGFDDFGGGDFFDF